MSAGASDRTNRLDALDELRSLADAITADCGDNSCLFKVPGAGGMRTNGGCRCFDSRVLPAEQRRDLQRLSRMLRIVRENIK